MSDISKKIEAAIQRVRAAVEQYNPIAVVGLFSGGHDSATANLIAHESGATMSLHINTGIGIQQTRDYVEETCDRRRWKYAEYKAVENVNSAGEPDAQFYEDIVRKEGFPGAFAHRMMYSRLKERPLRMFERDMGFTPKRPVIYLTGVRADESERRMGTNAYCEKRGRAVWLNHINDFTKSDCGNCMRHLGQPRNEVVDLIHKSGECLCGAFAKPGELAELRMWFPEVAKRIDDLEKEVMQRLPWGWEDNGPPDWWKEKNQGQMFMLDYDQLAQEQPLCRKCNLQAKAPAAH